MALPPHSDVIVLGAGAAGLMCAVRAGARGRRVLVLERNERAGKKILVSGGGRCNFTNRRVGAEHFHSDNPHFARSALARLTPEDVVALVRRHGIAFHEREWGQLFCNDSAKRIVQMLLAECRAAGVEVRTACEVVDVSAAAGGDGDGAAPASSPGPDRARFLVVARGPGAADGGGATFSAESLVVATGGLSWPRLGVSELGHRVARQFGLPVVEPRPGLVPLLWSPADRERFGPLAGIAVFARVRCGRAAFEENVLFTHDGLSGPAILQVSNVWRPGAELSLDLAPGHDVLAELQAGKADGRRTSLRAALAGWLPRRLVDVLLQVDGAPASGPRDALRAGEPRADRRPCGPRDAEGPHGPRADEPAPRGQGPATALASAAARSLGECADRHLQAAARLVTDWRPAPARTAGWDKAEVTLGGVDTRALSSRTMEARDVPGLYFVGECVDVTGWLGGFNFQWAWASGSAAGEVA